MNNNRKAAMLKRLVILPIFTILCFPGLSFADPIAMSSGPFLLAPVFLALEGVLIILLARRSLPYRIRFVVVWFFVTLITFACLTAWARLSKDIDLFGTMLAESLIVAAEASAIYHLLRWSFLVRKLEAAPSFSRALLYSLAANALSFWSSFVAVLIGVAF